MAEHTDPGGIDVELLLEDLKARAARRRALGDINPKVLDMPFDADDGVPVRGAIRIRPEVAYSSKPGVGRIITLAKRTLIRLQHHFIADIVSQANAALADLEDARRDEERARRELEARVAALEERLGRGGAGADGGATGPSE
jgi:hypothetical protein